MGWQGLMRHARSFPIRFAHRRDDSLLKRDGFVLILVHFWLSWPWRRKLASGHRAECHLNALGGSQSDANAPGRLEGHPASWRASDRIVSGCLLKAIANWSNHQTVIQITQAMEFATTARSDEVAASGR